ncbi:MAG: DUF3365 domain-containing protein [Planctomycetota bacterium]|nr:DUF3365 domain-containing protein [Planctomycetota bacterium]
MRRVHVLIPVAGAALIGVVAWSFCGVSNSSANEPKSAADPALQRTRKAVRMLDDLYKTAVVLITKHYINEDTDLSAGAAAKALFAEMHKKGWHEVQLLDVTGTPYNAKNVADDPFERKAVAALKSGKDYFDDVETAEGKRYLRAATPVPVVLKKCILCHENYRQAAKGEAIGALSYRILIE